METLKHLLFNNKYEYYPILGENTQQDNYCLMDFSNQNTELMKIDLKNTVLFSNFVFDYIESQNATFGIGGYAENRAIYNRSEHFTNEIEPRSIHLGIDIWKNEGTQIFTPFRGKVHSFKDNDNFGDYGPTIILEHQLMEQIFYTLYGHLSRKSLENIKVGKYFEMGEILGEIGGFPENGDWPPHLHFQIIKDFGSNFGDYPGVCRPSEKDFFLKNCPDPNLMLNIITK